MLFVSFFCIYFGQKLECPVCRNKLEETKTVNSNPNGDAEENDNDDDNAEDSSIDWSEEGSSSSEDSDEDIYADNQEDESGPLKAFEYLDCIMLSESKKFTRVT